MAALTPEELAVAACPNLYDVGEFLRSEGELEPKRLSEESAVTTACLVLFDAFATYLWIGTEFDRELCAKAFGKPSAYCIAKIEPVESEENRRLYSLLKGNVRLFIEGKSVVPLFHDRLVEDTTSTHFSADRWVKQLTDVSRPQTPR
jgi:hypothetical protein